MTCSVGGVASVALSGTALPDVRLVQTSPTPTSHPTADLALGGRLVGVSVDSSFVFANQDTNGNSTNHVNFSNPGASIGSSSAGVISASLAARVMQGGLTLRF